MFHTPGFLTFNAGLDSQNGLGVDLANVRFAKAANLGDFLDPKIFEIVKRQDLFVESRKLLNALANQPGQFTL